MKIAVFGEATVSLGGQLVPRVPANFLRIIVYLLLENANHSVSRGKLSQILWSDTDQSHASMNLRQSLARIRKFQDQYGLSLIQGDATYVYLNLSQVKAELLRIDLLEYIELERKGDIESLMRMTELYTGDLLAQNEPQASDFDEWLDVKRVKLRDDLTTMLLRMIDRPVGVSIDEKRQCARKLVEIDPYQEVGYRALMQTASQLGLIAKVERTFRECAKKLRDDLDVDPEEETIELYQQLLPKLSPATTRGLIITQPALPITTRMEIQTPYAMRAASQIEQNRQVGLPRIMVLYLPHNASDPMEQLAASLVDDITIGLCRLRTLSVVAPYTSRRIVTDAPVDGFDGLKEQFGVHYAVDSKIVRRDGFCFLSVKLIDTETQEIVWAEKQKFDYVLPEQQYRQLSIRIILSVVSVIEKSELDRYNKLEQDPNAYYWYLMGKREIDKFDLPKLRQARQSFKNALTASPDFVPALSGIARTMQKEWLMLSRSEKGILLEGEQIAKRAAPADPDDERPLRELGTISMYLGKFEDSLQYFDQGESINPQHADLLADYSDALTHYGWLDQALEKIQQAIAHNPLAPDYYYWVGGGALHNLERHSEAVDLLEQMQNPRAAARLLAACYAMKGEKEKACEYKKQAMEDNPTFRIDDWIKGLGVRLPEQRQRYENSLREAGFQ
ncbi:BTAD domain-containing putative transcriptional regulator [Phyllobacterium sp. YR531]|uniref:BTAD domain-containing putative transcriptional regulator n=1 Tax=Phyllobacterium sp. YR531 TaxID=1144343 RepID=UPI00026F873C|nr:BTAD domain-containing putative transcriptional regulator [Phyllobacterium sp. YR531]EJN02135.1 DNA-binding transcriptional activator of the SARP family [Phyllobacterium sp. YR531]